MKVVGEMAKKIKMDATVSGVLIKKNFEHIALEPEDLFTHTGLPLSTIHNIQKVPFGASVGLCQHHLHLLAGEVKVEGNKLNVFQCINITINNNIATIEWPSSQLNDFNADLVLQCLLQIQANQLTNQLNVKQEVKAEKDASKPHPPISTYKQAILQVLHNLYGCKSLDDVADDVISTRIGDHVVQIEMDGWKVKCGDEEVEGSVRKVVERVRQVTLPPSTSS